MRRVVVDTNILIAWYKSGTVSTVGNSAAITPLFSVITKIEALGFRHISAGEVKVINALLGCGEIVGISDEIVERTIQLRQRYKVNTPDAIIAATALASKAELWTANIDDFAAIHGLTVHDPLNNQN